MTSTDIQEKSTEAEKLKVYKVSEDQFLVESSEGQIYFQVIQNGKLTCPCRDYTMHVGRDPEYKCQHILAVLNTEVQRITTDQISGDSKAAKLEKRYIINLHGKDFVLYAGLLDLSHQKGLVKLEVEPIQYPTKDNGMEAIVKAVAVSRFGEVYSDLGDSNPSNTNKSIALHVLRMASTRAKARVLRDFTNVGMTCLEELGSMDEAIEGNGNGNGTNQKSRKNSPRNTQADDRQERPADQSGARHSEPAKQTAPVNTEKKDEPQQASNQPPQQNANPQNVRPGMSEAQKRAIFSLAKRRGISEENLAAMCRESYGTDRIEELSSTAAAAFIRTLQTAA